jgi:hypothetical protein
VFEGLKKKKKEIIFSAIFDGINIREGNPKSRYENVSRHDELELGICAGPPYIMTVIPKHCYHCYMDKELHDLQLIYCNNAVSRSDYIASNGRMTSE